jgi:hypothetical protein
VADIKELEIELGYFNWEREKRNTTFFSPKVVLNYGVIHNLEVVGEFAVEEPGHGSARLVDAALSVKAVVKVNAELIYRLGNIGSLLGWLIALPRRGE